MDKENIQHWLWRENLGEEFISALCTNTRIKETEVAQEGEIGKVMRYNDPKLAREAMSRVLNIGMSKFMTFWDQKKNHVIFESTQDLIDAAEPSEHKIVPQLRHGQIIFGTRSAAWMKQFKEDRILFTSETWFYNLIAPIICYQDCGEARKYPCLHGAVYAGKYAALKCDYCRDMGEAECVGHHWVIENIGNFKNKKINS